jgi:hypothetical protein
MASQTIVTTLRAPAGLSAQLVRIADELGLSQSEIIRRGVCKFAMDLDKAESIGARYDLLHSGLTAAKALEAQVESEQDVFEPAEAAKIAEGAQ